MISLENMIEGKEKGTADHKKVNSGKLMNKLQLLLMGLKLFSDILLELALGLGEQNLGA